jgi:hypothetical protein
MINCHRGQQCKISCFHSGSSEGGSLLAYDDAVLVRTDISKEYIASIFKAKY